MNNLNLEGKIKSVRTFVLGFIMAAALIASYSVYVRFDALKIAFDYPEVVRDLKIERQLEVKK